MSDHLYHYSSQSQEVRWQIDILFALSLIELIFYITVLFYFKVENRILENATYFIISGFKIVNLYSFHLLSLQEASNS